MLAASPLAISEFALSTVRQTFLRNAAAARCFPTLEFKGEYQGLASDLDPIGDVLSFRRLRLDIYDAHLEWIRKSENRTPSTEECKPLLQRLHQLTSPDLFFYGGEDLEIFRPVATCPSKGVAGDRRSELTFSLLNMNDVKDEKGVLLTAGSGTGKTVALWKAFFDCIFKQSRSWSPENSQPLTYRLTPLLMDFAPCWLDVRSRSNSDLVDKWSNASKDDFIIDLLVTSSGQLTGTKVRESKKESISNRERESRDRVRQYLEHGPRCLFFLDLNHAKDYAIRRAAAKAAIEFQNTYWGRHRLVIAFRAVSGDDRALQDDLAKRFFQDVSLEPITKEKATQYMRAFLKFERAVYQEIAAFVKTPMERFCPSIQIAPHEIEQECQRLSEVIRHIASEPSPLSMHLIAQLRGDKIRNVQGNTDLYRQLVDNDWDRESANPLD